MKLDRLIVEEPAMKRQVINHPFFFFKEGQKKKKKESFL